jgi:hypothetical protein
VKWLCEENDRAMGMRSLLDGKTQRFEISHKQMYFLNIIDCADSGWEAQVSYKLYSTENMNQLSLDDIPLPGVYFGLSLAWAVLLFGWSIELLRNRKHQSPLHYIIWGVLVLKEAVVGLIYFYWWMYSSTGHRFTVLSTLQSFLFAFSETAFFGVLYLTSKGWRIIRSGLPATEIRSTFIALIILTSTLLFFSFYNTEYYWLSLVLMYFFMLPKIFTSISQNIRLLDAQIALFMRHTNELVDADRYLSLMKRKRFMFHKIRNSLVVYLISMLVVNSLVRVLVAWDYLWITRLCDEVIVVLIVGYVAWNVRPSQNIFFTSLEEMAPFLSLRVLLENRLENQGDDEDRNEVEAWDIHKTVAIQWPFKLETERVWNITRLPLSLGYEERYIRQNLDDEE